MLNEGGESCLALREGFTESDQHAVQRRAAEAASRIAMPAGERRQSQRSQSGNRAVEGSQSSRV